jgi:hypothetical protein
MRQADPERKPTPVQEQSSSVLGFAMPEDFDIVRYEAVHSHVTAQKEAFPESYRQFADAWRAIAYRFKSTAEHDLTFRESIQRAGDAPPQPERYIQERELFCFFVAGLAVLESLCYGLFAVASMLDADNFPVVTDEDLRSVTPIKATQKFARYFPGDGITNAMQGMINDTAYSEWKRVRNVLAHRTAPGRIIYFSVGSTPKPTMPAHWKIGMQIDEGTTSSRRKWLPSVLT